MAMATQKAANGGRRRRRISRHVPISEINVTPFVDVMLVLLIVFMVAAPMLTVGVPIDLPETEAGALNSETQPIAISINKSGKIFLQETVIPMNEILAKLKEIAKSGYEERIYIRGNKTTDYDMIMKVMARIYEAGYRRISLVTMPEQTE